MTRSGDEEGTAGDRSAFAPSPRPRALFSGLLAWFVFSLAASVWLAPLAYALLADLLTEPPHFRRVTRRVVQAAALAFGYLVLRRLGVRGPRDFGYGTAPDALPCFVRSLLSGFAFAGAMLAFDFATGARSWQAVPDPGAVALGIVGVALLAFVEEACFRGALLFPFGRLSGVALAGAATTISALYATVHFVRGGMRASGTDFSAALAIWQAVPKAVGDHFEAWVGLFALGLALDFAARRRGDAWGVTGLHLGGGLALSIAGGASDFAPGARSPFFVDGLLPGYGFAVALAVVGGALFFSRRARAGGGDAVAGELSPASVSRERGRPSRAR